MKASFSEHLINLLYKNDCVIVPNMGGFLTEREPAKIHPVSHRFMPPSKSVLFNSRLTKNDGLLANAISSATEVPYKEAIKNLLKEVEQIKKALNKGEAVELEKLGKLMKGIEGNVSFVPYGEVNLLTEAYGLTEFKSSFVVREETREAKDGIYQTASALDTVDVQVREVKVQKWWYAAAAAAVVVSVGVYGLVNQDKAKEFYRNYAYLNPFKPIPNQTYSPRTTPLNQFNKVEELKFPGAEAYDTIRVESSVEEGAPKETIEPAATPAKETEKPKAKPEARTEDPIKVVAEPKVVKEPVKKEEAPVVKEAPKKVEKKTESKPSKNAVGYAEAKYFIIAGAFSEQANAEKLAKNLRAKGYDALDFKYGSKGMNFVAYGGYTTSTAANQALNKVKLEAADAWIMRK